MAVPSSGAISLAGIRAEITTNTYNASATVLTGLAEASTGTYGTINTSNDPANRPNGSTPHAMSEFYVYDHDLSSFNDNISFDFDGANDYLEAGGNLAAAISVVNGSISTWIKIDSMSANGLIWAINTEEGSTDQIFLLWNNASGVVRANFKGGNVANIADSSSGLENDGSWHHFVVTWQASSKGAANIIKLYQDGSLEDSDAIGTVFSGSPAIFGFGRNALQNFGQNFNGHMNDMAIFNDVLTSSEVSSIYNSGAPKDEAGHSGLIAYYTLEGYSDNDTTVADDADAGNNHSLTITNSTNIDSTDTP
tara:strand:- start:32 stop:955 length:924 start_codon:yes stop_codon:yes gene_type:complete